MAKLFQKKIKSFSRSNQAELKSLSSFKSAFEYASIGMALVSTKGKWLQVNNSLCKMLGYSKKELCTIDFQAITHPEYLEADLSYVKSMLEGKIDYYEMEKIYFHKDGSYVWGLLSVSLVLDSSKKPKYFISQIQNITKRKEAEKINEEYMKELKLSNEQLEEFAHITSHDLKEPIRGVSNYASMILDEYGDTLDTEIQRMLNKQIKLLAKMQGLLDDLLYYSKVGHAENAFTSCNTLEIISSAIELQEVFIKENNVEVVINDIPKEICCDPLRIQEVFYNLINNGIKYNICYSKKIIIGFDNHTKTFSIQDNGMGISELQKDKVFKIFKRAHSAKNLPEGSGLGLSVVKKIINRHKGEIWHCENKNGPGVTFFFSIGEL